MPGERPGPGPEFLKGKYGLHNAPEVEAAAEKTEQLTGEAPKTAEAKIQNYLDRLERLVLDPKQEQQKKMFGGESRPRALTLLREMVLNKYVRPNKEKMAAGAARVEERAARNLGIEAHYGEAELAERGDIAVKDLEKSLDNWISYLSDANEPYPVWFRYYAFRNVLDLGDYDKDKGEFTKRSAGSTRLFPDIDRGALAYVEQMIEASRDPVMLGRLQKAQQAVALEDIPQEQLITKERAAKFAKLSFAKQYAEGIRQAGEITPEMRQETHGKWVKYQKGTDPTALWASLQNKGTAWCTKGFATAETQLKGGDFYVYYTNDRQGNPAIPRIAIRMQGEQIGEARGVADNDQNLEGNMAAIADEKMQALPGAERYRKASSDMKQLTSLEKKVTEGLELTGQELRFLYELNSPIEGFGYESDPRIAELRGRRNAESDMLIVFDATPEQIAHSATEIRSDTKAYVGPLEPGIFTLLSQHPQIEHIYTHFPDRPIRRERLRAGGKTAEQYIAELQRTTDSAGRIMQSTPWAQDMLQNKEEFRPSETVQYIDLFYLSVGDLMTPEEVKQRRHLTTQELFYNPGQMTRIEEYGLELAPAETGPELRRKLKDQPVGDVFWVGMQPITDRGGDPGVFKLGRDSDGSWLNGSSAHPDDRWYPGNRFAFRVRK